MSSYCLKCKENTKNIDPTVSKTSNNKLLLSKCAICVSKKPRFIKKQETSGILSSLGLKTPISRFYYLMVLCLECNSVKSI